MNDRRTARDPRPTARVALAAAALARVALARVALTGAVLALASCDDRSSSAGNAPAAAAPGLAPLRVADAVADAADEALRADQPERAEAVLRAAVAQHPADADLRLAYHDLLMRLGPDRAADALAQLEEVIALGGATAADHLRAGQLAAQLERHADAERWLTQARTLDPSNAQAALWLATVLAAQRRADESQAQAALTVALDPSLDKAWFLLARAALDQGASELALQHIARARALDPAQPAYAEVQARALQRLDRPAEALLALDTVPDAALAEPALVRLRAELFGLMGDARAAARAYERAFERTPALRADPQLLFEAATRAERASDLARALDYARQAEMLGHATAAQLRATLEQR